jgi:cell division protein FtsN
MAPPPRPAPAVRVDANAPLSIVPNETAEAPPPRLRTALARPAEAPVAARAEPSATASGGYAVQVTSQRSETGAQAEFRALKAKFPNQLGGRAPLIRRADLGAKGVYYRALVGPFASAEQATAMCSGLKSAGGSCIVQRN